MNTNTVNQDQDQEEGKTSCRGCGGASCGRNRSANNNNNRTELVTSRELLRKTQMLHAVRDQRDELSDKLARTRVDLERCKDRRDYFRSMASGFHRIIEVQADAIFNLKKELEELKAKVDTQATEQAAAHALEPEVVVSPVAPAAPEPATVATSRKASPKFKKSKKKEDSKG